MDATRLFIEAVVARALREIRRSPARALRNLVDLGIHRVRGRFSRQVLDIAQHMLENPDSMYYRIAERTVCQVDLDTLRTFGMNLGYNSFTRGAKLIREKEAETGINIPWAITFSCRGEEEGLTPGGMDGIITAGKALGIYSYLFHGTAGELRTAEEVVAKHGDCAFFLFIEPADTAAGTLGWTAEHHHLMISLDLADPAFLEGWGLLRGRQCLGTVYARYGEAGMPEAHYRAAVTAAAECGSPMLFLVADHGTGAPALEAARGYAAENREHPEAPVAVLDLYYDLMQIDAVISGDACYLGIRRDGRVWAGGAPRLTEESALTDSLWAILCRLGAKPGGEPPPVAL